MSDKEIQAINNLASMEEDDSDYTFQPLKPILSTQMEKNKPPRLRPKTVEVKGNRTIRVYNGQSKRQELKKRLRILQQINLEQETPKNSKRVVTSSSVFCMAVTPTSNKNNGFPSHPIKKQTGQKMMSTRYSATKQNYAPRYSRINPEELIREDIMKKFKLRESMRQSDKITKINNFLKMAATTQYRSSAVPIFLHRKDQKLRSTLTSLLS